MTIPEQAVEAAARGIYARRRPYRTCRDRDFERFADPTTRGNTLGGTLEREIETSYADARAALEAAQPLMVAGPVPDCWAPWHALADAPVIPTKPNLKSTLFLGSRYGSVADAREIFQGDGHGNQCVAVAINGDVAERLVRAANAALPLMGVQRPEDVARVILKEMFGEEEWSDVNERIVARCYEIADAVLALPHTIAPEDVKRVLAVAHPDMQDHDFSVDAAEIAAHTGQVQEGIPLQECEGFRSALEDIANPLNALRPVHQIQSIARRALSVAPSSPQRAEGEDKNPLLIASDWLVSSYSCEGIWSSLDAMELCKAIDAFTHIPAPQAGCAKEGMTEPSAEQLRTAWDQWGSFSEDGDRMACALRAGSPPSPVAESGGLPPIDESLHSPDVVESLQHSALVAEKRQPSGPVCDQCGAIDDIIDGCVCPTDQRPEKK